MERLFVSVAEAAAVLGIGKTKMFELLASGQIESVQLDRRRLVPADGLRSYADEQRRLAATKRGNASALASAAG